MQQQAKDFISKYKWVHVISDVPEGVQKEYEVLFEQIFKRETSCSGCSSGQADYEKLVAYANRKEVSSYILKNDVVAYCKFTNDYYTNDNLTDDVAQIIIQEVGTDQFAFIPEKAPEQEPEKTDEETAPEQPAKQSKKKGGK